MQNCSLFTAQLKSVFSVLVYSCLFITLPNSVNAQTNSLNSTIENGKRIYEQGILPNGQAVSATGAANTKLSGQQASCIGCHRRSGFGSIEGEQRISPILGDILYKQRNKAYKQLSRRRIKGHGARPAYTDQSLSKAITLGTGADKRTLNQLMPRYNFTDTDVNSVIQYLKTLTLKTEPGITKDKIHIATIVTSEVPNKSSATMVDLITHYIHDLNAKTRMEQKRASHSPWHKRWEYESYRNFELHIWKLTGPASSWNTQLQNYYNEQPVFSVINGISLNSWNVIHDFCNQIKLPCLFPTTELPNLEPENIYNVYYSGGIAYDAKTIAAHIKSEFKNKKKIILQIYRDDKKNKTAVKVLSRDLKSSNFSIKNHEVAFKANLNKAQWTKIIKKYQPNILISWLETPDVNALNSNKVQIKSIERLYYSYSHIGDQYPSIIKSNTQKSYIVYRNMLPKRKKLHITRATGWARRKNIDISNERIVGNAFFAATLFNRAVKKMRANLNQEYLLELVESMLENNAFQSVYPKLSLGPDQRIASKGAYILGPLNNVDVNKKENHVWLRH